MAITSDKKEKKCGLACDVGKECLKKITTPKEDEGPELDISPPRRGINWGREHREQMEEPESSGIEDVGEGPSEVVIHTPISRRTRQQV